MTSDKKFQDACRRIAAEGAVLLKNENHILPLGNGERVSVFGRIQLNWYRSGTGSGGAVHIAHETGLMEGLREKETICLNETLAAVYQDWVAEHPFDDGGGTWASEPWFQEEMPLTDEVMKEAETFGGKAVVVIGRTAGEDEDNAAKEGSYYLTETEKDMLRRVTASFADTVLLLNVPNLIDFSFISDPEYQGHIRAVLIAWQGGQEGGGAAADVLTGSASPSGHLTDTIAKSIEDYPAGKNFGDPDRTVYAEDIYVGYRYFETFAKDRVLYPFGFGLTYTSFALEAVHVTAKANYLIATVSVTNIGNEAGREVVQIYYRAPQGTLGRPARELAAFKKTHILEPGESQELRISYPIARMAAFDDSGRSGFRNAWVLEPGFYRIYIGENVRDAEAVPVDGMEGCRILRTTPVKQCEEACAPTVPFERLVPIEKDGRLTEGREAAPLRETDLEKRVLGRLPELIPMTGDRGITLKNVRHGKASLDEFVAQLTEKELMTLVRGEGMCSPKVTAGTAAAFGGVSESLLAKGVPTACCSDGPSGIRMDNGDTATQMPIGTLLASTWDPSLVRRLYILEGKELKEHHIDTLLGPGMNIHRHPLCGRNFEYFSEDPYLTGVMAEASVSGLQAGGADGTIKHFACNNQEYNRRESDSIVSARALREIYLRAFEYVITEGHADSLMTSYNRLNGHHAGSSYELTETILRKDWGYQGLVMTDWFTYLSDWLKGGEDDIRKTASMVRARNDVYMVVPNDGAEVNAMRDDLPEALESGALTVPELQVCAKDILGYLLRTPCMDRPLRKPGGVHTAEPEKSVPEGVTVLMADENGQILMPGDGESFFRIAADGVYDISFKAKYDAPATAQSAMSVRIGGKDAPMFSMGGSPFLPASYRSYARFELKAGVYRISWAVTKKGIEIEGAAVVPKGAEIRDPGEAFKFNF